MICILPSLTDSFDFVFHQVNNHATGNTIKIARRINNDSRMTSECEGIESKNIIVAENDLVCRDECKTGDMTLN
jgi:hypothetical protein